MIDLDHAQELLESISPDISRDEWVQIAMALKSEFGDEGFELFDQWSSGGISYDSSHAYATWRSINSKGGISIKTLFRFADEDWNVFRLNPVKESILNPSIDVLEQWNKANEPTKQHPYLVKKGLKPHGLKQVGNNLLIPIYTFNQGKLLLISTQSIDPNGNKRLFSGAPKKGGFFPIGSLSNGKTILISEGWATAAALNVATGLTSIMAVDAGNLIHAAKLMRETYPEREVILCADNDEAGIEGAKKAANAINAKLVVAEGENKADFWDQWKLNGPESVLNTISGYALDHYPEVIPLNTALPPVKTFTSDMLPRELVNWAQDIIDRLQCPPDYIGVTIMIALASVIGRKVVVYPKAKDDWLVVPNLWGALVGRPSMMKTPAMNEGLKPLKAIADKARTKSEKDLLTYKAAQKVHEIKNEVTFSDAKAKIKKAIKNSDQRSIELYRKEIEELEASQVREPTQRRYIVNDPTVEKLGELLNENSNGLLLERDELAGLLQSLNREDRTEARAFYLEAFNGTSSFTFDRIGRGTVHIENALISLIGGIQPGKLTPFVWNAINQGAQDDGLLQRLQLIVYPDMPKEYEHIDRSPDKEAKDEANSVFQRLDDLSMSDQDESGSIIGLRFTDDAQMLFDLWMKELESEVRATDIHPAIEAHLIKYRSLMPSIALIISLVEEGPNKPISIDATTKAFIWCEYLKSHMYRVYAGAINPMEQAAKLILERKDKLPSIFKARDIQMMKWAGLRKAEDVHNALKELEETNHIFGSKDQNTGGRPSLSYIWNPRLKSEQNYKS